MSLWDKALLEHFSCDSLTEEWTSGMLQAIKEGKFIPNRVSALIIKEIQNSEGYLKEERETLRHIIDNYAEWSTVKMLYVVDRMSAKEILDRCREKKRREDIMEELKP